MAKYLILALVIISCSNDNSVVEPDKNTDDNSSLKLFSVNIDLLSGFEGQTVYLRIDSLKYYNALLSEYVPVAGPLSSFKTFLEEGNHKLFLIRNRLDGTNSTKVDSTEIEIGNFEKYFIGLSVYNDSLYVLIQDIQFKYL